MAAASTRIGGMRSRREDGGRGVTTETNKTHAAMRDRGMFDVVSTLCQTIDVMC